MPGKSWFGSGSVGSQSGSGKKRPSTRRPGAAVVASQPFLEGTPGRYIAKPSLLAQAANRAKQAELMQNYASSSNAPIPGDFNAGYVSHPDSTRYVAPNSASMFSYGVHSMPQPHFGSVPTPPTQRPPLHFQCHSAAATQSGSECQVSTLDRLHALRDALQQSTSESPLREPSILYDPRPQAPAPQLQVETPAEVVRGDFNVEGVPEFANKPSYTLGGGGASADHIDCHLPSSMRPHFISSPNLAPAHLPLGDIVAQAEPVFGAQPRQKAHERRAAHAPAGSQCSSTYVCRYELASANFPVTVDQVLPGLNAQPIPHWLRVYSAAAPQLDTIIHWDVFQLGQLDYFNECLLKLYKQDVVRGRWAATHSGSEQYGIGECFGCVSNTRHGTFGLWFVGLW